MKSSPIRRPALAAFSAVLVLASTGIVSSQTPSAPAPALTAVPMAQYLAYARASADYAWTHFDETIAAWRKSFDPKNVFGYRSPGNLLEMASIYAQLFERERKPEQAARAKKVLLTYGDYRSEFPDWARKMRYDYDDAVPALSDFFTVMRYIRAYEDLRRMGQLTAEEDAKCAKIISESIRYMLRTQEWGAMNRSMLRAENLAWAVRALPGDPDVKTWDMQRRALGDDNWGHWEIEDATIYHGVWLYSLLGYAEARHDLDGLFATPEIYYYAQYFLNLMSPAGMIPDFGDAHWEANWPHYLVFFEAAAARYKNPQIKWAAARMARKFVDFKTPTSVGLGYMFMDIVRWGSDAVAAAEPPAVSREVMEDIQGKKIVFRNGWGPQASYLLWNYRDEGDGGLNFRDYLRDTIPVEEEKMTHGHADENSIALLMDGGSVLLHDAGYRDYMPSGPYGQFRQDYFHNRLVVRPEKIFMGQKDGESRYSSPGFAAIPGQKVLDFLHDAGSYRKVRTQKVDFLDLPDIGYGRARTIDDNWGYQADRVIAYVKEGGFYVVFDFFKSLREEWFTLADLWHTRKIHAQGPGWFDTGYDGIANTAGNITVPLPQDKRLLIVLPDTGFRLEGVEPQKRHYQDEMTIHQTRSQHFELGESTGFVTVLIPHPAGADPAPLAASVKLLPGSSARAGLAVEITAGGRRFVVGAKADLRRDIARDNKRPRYLYEAGKVAFGDFETNGDFLFAAQDGPGLAYTIVNLTKALYKGKLLIENKPWNSGLAYDGSPDSPERGKLRYWRDVVKTP
ncbi:MAG: hypothetical protein NTZ26_08945 [Candidatus Aminicenantes bacterium]|nr:hypothetical protein [Candidatus Aminicenantes bacterium]